MSRTKIRELIRANQLHEAMQLAKEQYESNPQADWARMDLADVAEHYCCMAAEMNDKDFFKLAYVELQKVNVWQMDKALGVKMCWNFRTLLANQTKDVDDLSLPHVVQSVWELVEQMPRPQTSLAASVLCKTFYRVGKAWPSFVEFMDWWGWETFRPEDYQREKLPNGKLMPLSLAEECHVVCARLFLQDSRTEQKQAFAARLQALGEAHSEMLYAGYYATKLLLSVGAFREETLRAALPFVRQKSPEFWAWQLLAEVEKENEEVRLGCLVRAVNCKTSDAFLVNVLSLLAGELVARSDYVGASLLLQRYLKVKADTQSFVPSTIQHWVNQPWYQPEKCVAAQSPWLSMDYMDVTDHLLYADVPEQPAYVTYVDEKSGFASVICGCRKRGRIRLPKAKRNVKRGILLMVRLDRANCKGEHLAVYTVRVVPWSEMPETDFLKTVEGVVTTNAVRTTFFVHFGKEYAMVPQELANTKALQASQKVRAKVALDYHKAKNEWLWKVVAFD